MDIYQERKHAAKYTAEYELASRLKTLAAEASSWQNCARLDYITGEGSDDKALWQRFTAESSALARFALFRLIDMNAGRL